MKGHVVENTDEKVVVQFPWHIRAVGFYDGLISNTDVRVDLSDSGSPKSGGRDTVTVWLKRGRG